MIFLFPNDCFNRYQPDEVYRDRYEAFRAEGFKTALVEIESLSDPNCTTHPILEKFEQVVYLGWMLSGTDYQLLTQIIERAGAVPIHSCQQYLATHYLPNWYPLISDLTPETKILSEDDDLVGALQQLGWQKFFIKDYVKSLKTSLGAIIEQPQQITAVLAEMKKYRGSIEGGICVRRVEDFIPESEQRYFVILGKAFAPERGKTIPAIVQQCLPRIASKFFTVDVIKTQDGLERIVEIGDGQVSDLVGWSVSRFIEIWRRRLPQG